MKNKILILLSFLITSTLAIGQTARLEINEVLYKDVLRPSIEVEMVPSAKDVKKAWKNFIEDQYDADVSGYGLFANKDILSTSGATIRPISEKKIDLYSKIIRDGNKTKMNVYGTFGYDSFITPDEHSKAFRAMHDVVGDFVASFLPNYFAEVVDETRDEVEDAADNVADLEKKIERNKEEINDLTKENIELTEELVETRKMLSELKKNLNKDKKKLETVKDKVSKNEFRKK